MLKQPYMLRIARSVPQPLEPFTASRSSFHMSASSLTHKYIQDRYWIGIFYQNPKMLYKPIVGKGRPTCWQKLIREENILVLFLHQVLLDPVEVVAGGNEDDPLVFLVILRPELVHGGVEKPWQVTSEQPSDWGKVKRTLWLENEKKCRSKKSGNHQEDLPPE